MRSPTNEFFCTKENFKKENMTNKILKNENTAENIKFDVLKKNIFNNIVLENLNKKRTPLLKKLSKTHSKGNIYYNLGKVLISINPNINEYIDDLINIIKNNEDFDFKNFEGNSNPELIAKYSKILQLASKTKKDLFLKNKNVSIIIEGESGSGKSVSMRILMNYFLFQENKNSENKNICSLNENIQNKNIKNSIDYLNGKIDRTIFILESFGNSKTVLNSDSSRFGKVIRLFYDKDSQKLVKGDVKVILLERGRVCNIIDNVSTALEHSNQNFTFKIFYFFISFYDLSNTFKFYSNGIKNSEFNTENYTEILKSLNSLKIDTNFIELKIFSIILFLHLEYENILQIYEKIANLDFNFNLNLDNLNVKDLINFCFSDNKELKNLNILNALCLLSKTLFETKNNDEDDKNLSKNRAKNFITEILNKTISIKDEKILKLLTKEEFNLKRSNLIENLYEELFYKILKLCNKNLSLNRNSKKNKLLSIEILDIYGFENLPNNNLFQLLINYTNERLSSIFIDDVYKKQKELVNDNIAKEMELDFNFNKNRNKSKFLCKKIEKTVFKNILEEMKFKFNLISKISNEINKNPNKNIIIDKVKLRKLSEKSNTNNFEKNLENCFAIKHFSSKTIYDSKNFCNNNLKKNNLYLIESYKIELDKILKKLRKNEIVNIKCLKTENPSNKKINEILKVQLRNSPLISSTEFLKKNIYQNNLPKTKILTEYLDFNKIKYKEGSQYLYLSNKSMDKYYKNYNKEADKKIEESKKFLKNFDAIISFLENLAEKKIRIEEAVRIEEAEKLNKIRIKKAENITMHSEKKDISENKLESFEILNEKKILNFDFNQKKINEILELKIKNFLKVYDTKKLKQDSKKKEIFYFNQILIEIIYCLYLEFENKKLEKISSDCNINNIISVKEFVLILKSMDKNNKISNQINNKINNKINNNKTEVKDLNMDLKSNIDKNINCENIFLDLKSLNFMSEDEESNSLEIKGYITENKVPESNIDEKYKIINNEKIQKVRNFLSLLKKSNNPIELSNSNILDNNSALILYYNLETLPEPLSFIKNYYFQFNFNSKLKAILVNLAKKILDYLQSLNLKNLKSIVSRNTINNNLKPKILNNFNLNFVETFKYLEILIFNNFLEFKDFKSFNIKLDYKLEKLILLRNFILSYNCKKKSPSKITNVNIINTIYLDELIKLIIFKLSINKNNENIKSYEICKIRNKLNVNNLKDEVINRIFYGKGITNVFLNLDLNKFNNNKNSLSVLDNKSEVKSFNNDYLNVVDNVTNEKNFNSDNLNILDNNLDENIFYYIYSY